MPETIESLISQVAVLQERVRGMEAARELQAAEYARRLEDLNHAQKQREDRDHDFISRERFDSKVGEIERRYELKFQEMQKADDGRRDYVDARLREIDRFRWIAVGLGAGAGGLVGWIAKLL